jgi:hypothetical protein
VASDNRKLIRSLENEFRDALLSKDSERLRSLIHPQFLLIGTRASGPFTINRDEWLESVQRREIVSIDVNRRDAIVFEGVMVGTIEARWTIRYLGTEIQDRVLLSDVWVMDEGRWCVVRRHSSPVPPEQKR